MSLDNWCEFPVPCLGITILPPADVEITSDYTVVVTSHFLYSWSAGRYREKNILLCFILDHL